MENQSHPNYVMDKLKDLIIRENYTAGDKIPTETELSELFGIGRSSIREAIKVFNYLGIMESRKAKGTFLNDRSHITSEVLGWALLLGKDEMYELVELRESLELWSILNIMTRVKENADFIGGLRKKLEGEVERMRGAVTARSIDTIIDADFHFHLALVEAGENRLFVYIYRLLRNFMYYEIKTTYADYMDDWEYLVEKHSRFIANLQEGDLGTALDWLRDHIDLMREEIAMFMDNAAPPPLDFSET